MRFSLIVFDKQISQRLSRTISLSHWCLGHPVTPQWPGKVHHPHFQRICPQEPQIIYWTCIILEFTKSAGDGLNSSEQQHAYLCALWKNNVVLCRTASPGTALLIVSGYVTHHQWLLLLCYQTLPISSNKKVRKYLSSNESQWKLSDCNGP